MLPRVESELMSWIVGVWGDFGALASYVHGFVGGRWMWICKLVDGR